MVLKSPDIDTPKIIKTVIIFYKTDFYIKEFKQSVLNTFKTSINSCPVSLSFIFQTISNKNFGPVGFYPKDLMNVPNSFVEIVQSHSSSD